MEKVMHNKGEIIIKVKRIELVRMINALFDSVEKDEKDGYHYIAEKTKEIAMDAAKIFTECYSGE